MYIYLYSITILKVMAMTHDMYHDVQDCSQTYAQCCVLFKKLFEFRVSRSDIFVTLHTFIQEQHACKNASFNRKHAGKLLTCNFPSEQDRKL